MLSLALRAFNLKHLSALLICFLVGCDGARVAGDIDESASDVETGSDRGTGTGSTSTPEPVPVPVPEPGPELELIPVPETEPEPALDSDRDGIPDSEELGVDSDGDGTPNFLDDDSDNDGIPDSIELALDTDGDGLPDYIDNDSDGDTIPDSSELVGDADSDGIPNFRDSDSDGDNVPDAVEGNIDTDGDGTPDYLAIDPGDRAHWLRGTWGISWDPSELYNGHGENLTADRFLQQIAHLKTIDFVQSHLGDQFTTSAAHFAPSVLLESLWEGDLDADGKPINLLVPRIASGDDPFFDILTAIKTAGMRNMTYVNSSNLLSREGEAVRPEIPNIEERWTHFCDTSPTAVAYLDSQSYHRDAAFPNRHYMFCYTEFVLKPYSLQYGDLIDAWIFDSAEYMSLAGDNATNGVAVDQRIYEAFAVAARAGNPNAAVSFNNGPERDTEELNPFSEAVRVEDYKFGHPYNGGRVIGNRENGLYDRNYAHIQKVTETNGNVHAGGDWTWDDKIVGHFYPPMSTTSWNGGSTAALTDAEFLQWNLESAVGGGSISWGVPLIRKDGLLNQLLINDWGIAQLTLMDDHLAENESPGAPNWARAATNLADAAFAQPFNHTLVEGVDFWDPESDGVTLSLVDSGSGIPGWLSITEDAAQPGVWILSGTPTESVDSSYQFTLRAEDASGYNDREVNLLVTDAPDIYPYESNVDILAAENTAYGVNTIATMMSDTITAPDGMATFQIALDVTPEAGGEIVTGDVNTNTTTSSSWGIGEGQFTGTDDDRVESIGNIRVINFNANGSTLTASDITEFSFEYAYVSDGQSAGDRIEVEANGVVNVNGGLSLNSNPDTLSLKVQGYIPITELVLGVGTDASNNKWSVNSINVSYTIN